MYRLAELTDIRRRTIGGTLLALGILGLILGVIWIHWSSLSETEVINGETVPVVVDYLNWWPRGPLWKGLGYLIVLGSTTFVLVGVAFRWVLNERLTWARAAFSAILMWFTLVFFFGMVPSEWLSFAQTDLEWGNEVALVIPPILVLGNTVEISYAILKEAIQMGYSLGMLGVGIVLAIQLQNMKKGRPASAAAVEPKSPYGRPLVKGGG
jgi:hypothetical protein